jgi:hypothetical protein
MNLAQRESKVVLIVTVSGSRGIHTIFAEAPAGPETEEQLDSLYDQFNEKLTSLVGQPSPLEPQLGKA